MQFSDITVLFQVNSKKKSVLLVISIAGIKVCSPDGKVGASLLF